MYRELAMFEKSNLPILPVGALRVSNHFAVYPLTPSQVQQCSHYIFLPSLLVRCGQCEPWLLWVFARSRMIMNGAL